MHAIEKAADAAGLTYDMMMDNAGLAVKDAILEKWGSVDGKRILVLVGVGNNGGDGLVAANLLAQNGAEVEVYLTKARPEDDPRLMPLVEREMSINVAEEDQRSSALRRQVETADILIDAVLGTGTKLPLKGSAKAILGSTQKYLRSREKPPFIVAVDCPSGLDCDSGEIGAESIRADLTVTLAAAKTGQFRFPGAASIGELIIGDIGLDPELEELTSVKVGLAEPTFVRSCLPNRPMNAHKGTFGQAVIVAGSTNYPGAAVLAGQGAYRIGAGLVTLAIPASIQPIAGPQIPEATWLLLPHDMGVIAEGAEKILLPEFKNAQAVLIGPGFGLEKTTVTFLNRLLETSSMKEHSQIGFTSNVDENPQSEISFPPCVVDADGLRLLKQITNWDKRLPPNSILTPHPGEMGFLTDEETNTIQRYRVESARHWSASWGHVVVLKGAFTVVAAPDGRISILPFANPALARAGTGDVLAGMIAGLLAQGVEPYDAAVVGAYLHGSAGEIAESKLGYSGSVMAGEVARLIPDAISQII